MDIIAGHINSNGVGWSAGWVNKESRFKLCRSKRFVPTWKSPNQVWVPPGLVKMDTRAFPSDKRMEPEVDYFPPSSTQVNACNYVQQCVFLVHIGTPCTFYHYTICSCEQREFPDISQKDLNMVQMPL